MYVVKRGVRMLCGGECVCRVGVCMSRGSVYVERSVYVEGECVCRGGVRM